MARWERDVNGWLQSAEKRPAIPASDGQIFDPDGFLRKSAAEMLLELAEVYGTDVGTVVHGLVLWDRFISSRHALTMNLQNVLRASVACFMISAKLRDVKHPAIQNLANFTSFQCEELVRSEESVLLSLDWNISCSTGVRFSFRLLMRFPDPCSLECRIGHC
jgi:hypothetical protein